MITTNPITGTAQATIWEKGNKSRYEITSEGTTIISIFDMDAGVYYMSSGENIWMAMTLGPSTIPEGVTENPNDILDYNPQTTGTETIDGKSCTVITWEIPDTGTMTEWIWTEKGFPVKMETITSEGTTTIEFTNIDFSDIDDSMFELPDGAIVTTIGP
jgi:outer membrane lipoprotein-sorting protein